MELIIAVLVPIVFLMLAASMLVVSQISGYFHFTRYSRRQQRNKRDLAEFVQRLAAAQAQIYSRNRELERLSAQLRLNNQELARLNSMKSKFLSMAAHDVRTPLASIKGFGGLLLDRTRLDRNQREYMRNIVQATEQINRLIGDLTDLAVIEAGKLRMDKRPFDLRSILNEVVPAIQVVAQSARVVLAVQPVPEGVVVVGDRFRLAQALMNLLNNAVKFTPAGGRVELAVSVNHAARTALFAVKDTGPGIHPSERRRLFEKFYQSRFTEASAARKGWGLGLAIAQEIVRAHQGEIGADSPGPGKGSTFWFRVPLSPARPERRAPAGAAALAALLIALALGSPARAQQAFPLEEKAKFERALEQKAESVLLHILGPSKSRVVVDATLDFTRIERFDVKSGAKDMESGAFLWQSVGASSSGQQAELLPGIPTPQNLPPATEAKSYERQNTFPASFVKRLAVTVVLDRGIDTRMADDVARILGDILDVRPSRGDALSVVRAPFAPAWKTIWHRPESVGLLFKYGLIGLLTLITLVVVAACFLKLADAMDSMAKAQTSQLQMDFGSQEGQDPAKPGQLPGPEGEDEEGEEVVPSVERVVFNVPPAQAGTLLELIGGQDPENIALIVAHLPPETKKEFLARLPPQLYGEVLLCLGSVRFVEPELVAAVKDELEKRLGSAIGGRDQILQLLEGADLKAKAELLALLQSRDPGLAAEVRRHVLLFEDLSRVAAKDWPHVLSSVHLEDWVAALNGAPEEIREALRSNMMPKTWGILSQMMEVGTPSESATARARERVVAAVSKLVAAGRMANPVTGKLEASTRLLESKGGPEAEEELSARPE